MNSPRTKVTTAFFVAALALAFASVASACTIWVGQFTVTTDNDGDGTKGNDPYEYVRTYGLGVGMNNCWYDGAIKLDVDNHGDPNPPSQIFIDYRSFTASSLPTAAGRAACAAADTRNPTAGNYSVSYLNTGFGDFIGGNTSGGTNYAVDSQAQREYVRDCMAVGGAASRWIDNEELTVNSSGVGTATVDIDAKTANGGQGIPDLPGTESAICIQQKAGSYTGAPDGAQAPIIVI